MGAIRADLRGHDYASVSLRQLRPGRQKRNPGHTARGAAGEAIGTETSASRLTISVRSMSPPRGILAVTTIECRPDSKRDRREVKPAIPGRSLPIALPQTEAMTDLPN